MAYYKKKEPYYVKQSEGRRREEDRPGGPGGKKREGGYRDGDAKPRKYGERDGDTKPRKYGEQDGDSKPRKYGERDERGPARGPGLKRGSGPKRGDAAKRAHAEEWMRKETRDERPPRPVRARDEAPVEVDESELPLLVYGRNPVKEAIKSGRSIDKVFVSEEGEGDGSLREIVRMARERSLVIVEVSPKKLHDMTFAFGYGNKGANHQGIVAQLPAVEYAELSDILAYAKEKGEAPFVVLLDSVMDPHNLGSIIRSAECAGAHGIVIPKRRAVSVTAAAARVSAGAVMYQRIARVPNLSAAIAQLKEAGLWIAGADSAGQPMGGCKLDGPLALVIGAEGEGLSSLVKKNCDFLVAAPLKGQIDSLNASVAAAVLMYEKLRQDAAQAK